MRLNEPITDVEVEITGEEPLVSRTDPAGAITFTNQVFVEVSGYSEQELLGAPHNIVRHPHMPTQAFADLWATVKAGRPWDGLVKNRAKSGGFYWVRANVTPVIVAGQATGYISIRSRPSRSEVAAAERAYAALRDGTAKHLALRDGELIANRRRDRLLDAFRSVGVRMTFAAFGAFAVLALVGWLGFSGMASSNAVLRTVYKNDLVSVDQLRGIVDRIRDNRNHIAQMTISLGEGDAADQALAEHIPPVRANLEQIAALWRDYGARPRTPDQRVLMQRFDARFAALLHDGIEPALVLAPLHKVAELDTLFRTRMPPLFQAVFDADRDLVARQIQGGREAYVAAVEDLRRRLFIGVGFGCIGLLTVLAGGWTLYRAICRPLVALEDQLRAVTRHEPGVEIATPKMREFRGVIAMLRAMRAHLSFSEWQRREFERKADAVRHETVEAMARTIETQTGGAVERAGDRARAMLEEAAAMTLSAAGVNANAEQTAGAVDQALRNAQVVAAASEELASSIREVSSQVDHASAVARDASMKGNSARETIRSLAGAGSGSAR